LSIKIIKTPKLYQGTKEDMKISQGFNKQKDMFFIYITDKKSKITLRINMDEEFYQLFHGMGNFTYKQTKKDEGEFTDDND
jgi:hypothetical protein